MDAGLLYTVQRGDTLAGVALKVSDICSGKCARSLLAEVSKHRSFMRLFRHMLYDSPFLGCVESCEALGHWTLTDSAWTLHFALLLLLRRVGVFISSFLAAHKFFSTAQYDGGRIAANEQTYDYISRDAPQGSRAASTYRPLNHHRGCSKQCHEP